MDADSMKDKVVLIDGECLACDRFANFLMDKDGGDFVFASQSSTKGREILDNYDLKQDESIVFLLEDTVYTESEALIRIFSILPGIWKYLRYLSIVPRPVRDFLYSVFSNHRYSVFGTTSSCDLDYEEDRIL